MQKMLMLMVLSVAVVFFVGCDEEMAGEQAAVEYRRITVDEYLDKMKAGWVGQMAGVGWALSPIPALHLRKWKK
jgi:hypothetical protein